MNLTQLRAQDLTARESSGERRLSWSDMFSVSHTVDIARASVARLIPAGEGAFGSSFLAKYRDVYGIELFDGGAVCDIEMVVVWG